jgi:hypothetical protein
MSMFPVLQLKRGLGLRVARVMGIKGIGREVVPYAVEGILDNLGANGEIFSEHLVGVDFFLDPSRVAADTSERPRQVLQRAIVALDRQPDEAPSLSP